MHVNSSFTLLILTSVIKWLLIASASDAYGTGAVYGTYEAVRYKVQSMIYSWNFSIFVIGIGFLIFYYN